MIHIKHPVIFLDVEGVINSEDYWKTKQSIGDTDTNNRIDPMAMNHLQSIIDKTDAQVVITSTWRKNDEDFSYLMRYFNDYAIPVIGVTPSTVECDRAKEIELWLQSHYLTHRCYVVLDDDDTGLNSIKDHVLCVDSAHGLTLADVDRTVEILAKFKEGLDEDVNRSGIERVQMLQK